MKKTFFDLSLLPRLADTKSRVPQSSHTMIMRAAGEVICTVREGFCVVVLNELRLTVQRQDLTLGVTAPSASPFS